MTIELQQWVGRQETCKELIYPNHVKKIASSLSFWQDGEDSFKEGDNLPYLWQWAFFIDPLNLNELGGDGHPKRGGFLPPADNRNRMWAGGRLQFIQPLKIGEEGTRFSTIKAIKEKEGSTGKLLFVTVLHEYFQEGKLCIQEEQDIVYREPSPPKLSGTQPAPIAQWSNEIVPSSVMLFRYSAVTFNGHRIHYDYPYSTQVEGYPGLVVHGPMIATYLLHSFLRAYPDKKVKNFSFRGLRPLICPTPFKVEGCLVPLEELSFANTSVAVTDGKTIGGAKLWAQQEGTMAQQAELIFEC